MREFEKTEIQLLAERVRKWVASEEGLLAIQKSATRDGQVTAKLRERMKVDDELLKKPFTV